MSSLEGETGERVKLLDIWSLVSGQLFRVFQEFHQAQLLNQLNRLFG